jgi:hypothetical protein
LVLGDIVLCPFTEGCGFTRGGWFVGVCWKVVVLWFTGCGVPQEMGYLKRAVERGEWFLEVTDGDVGRRDVP